MWLALLLCLYSNSSPTVVGYENGHRIDIEVASLPGKDYDQKPLYLRKDAAEAFLALQEAANKDGVYLHVFAAYRTHAQQSTLYRLDHAGLVAAPGHSSHEAGLAVDIDSLCRVTDDGCEPTAYYFWMQKNAARFRFYRERSDERWHFTYRSP